LKQGLKTDIPGDIVPRLQTVEAVRRFEPISCLPEDHVDELLDQSRIESYPAGTDLLAVERSDHEVVYLLKGELDMRVDGGAGWILRAGSEDARHPIADGRSRPLSAVAITPVEILRVDKELLDTMVTWSQIGAPEEAVVMSEDGIITIDKAGWLKTMLKSATFRRLPPANIEELLHRLEPIVVHTGDVIIRQGDPGDFFYMIDQGTALVTHNPENDQDSIELAELNKGATFGEAALLSNRPRNATVTMMSDGILLRLSKEDFDKLLTQPTLQWLTFDRAMEEISRGGRWIDVRLPSEFERSHLPGAISMPMHSLHHAARNLDPHVAYVCYCKTGRRSSAAAFILKQHGFKASVLKGGLDALSPAVLDKH
jgi:CRP-like cAMP-binding protein